ncbi:MAG: UDP-2,4-diacetamido-2,4,6-trideoxy-beta-L-altropyranose hydrolase [Alphaproteobacteria bacterium]|nr:UDP-2,4-diacetamido-2,4,6-trideoxy-beta-L-altropyranose hydrolase [Alphaproteobacteria bacterium]
MPAPSAYFRFYASHWRGAGHAFRCKALADELTTRGWQCVFVTEQESYDFCTVLKGYSRIDPDAFYKSPPLHDILVVDHYECGAEYETHFRPYAGKIVVIDDLMDKPHDADIIHNQSYGVTESHYAGLCPAHCRMLLGSRFALMKKEFQAMREKTLNRRRQISCIDRILINFGGNDQKNMILTSLQKLATTGYRGIIDVAYGLMAPHRDSVESFCRTLPNEIHFHVAPSMPDLMAQADFAIGAPAVTQWERFALGLPTLLIQTADNQSFTYQALMNDGFSVPPTLDDLDQPGWLIDFNASHYRKTVDLYQAQSSGNGAELFADAIINLGNISHDSSIARAHAV